MLNSHSLSPSDTIYVRVYEARMDLLRAVIIGPQGTPYHDGLFVFDVLFPQNYPDVPPVCIGVFLFFLYFVAWEYKYIYLLIFPFH